MSKNCLILDLDETLISSVSNAELKQLKTELEGDELKDLKLVTKGEKYVWGASDSDYITYERPGLQEFLDFAFDNFDVYIWTAGGKEYAVTLVEKIIMRVNPEKRDVKNIHFDYHCRASEEEYGALKDLRMFWEKYKIGTCNSKNTVIVDDNVYEVAVVNPDNCIVAKPFSIEKPTEAKNDRFLYDLKNQLQSQLEKDGAISSKSINNQNRMSIPKK